jgi:hypothetical protein
MGLGSGEGDEGRLGIDELLTSHSTSLVVLLGFNQARHLLCLVIALHDEHVLCACVRVPCVLCAALCAMCDV